MYEFKFGGQSFLYIYIEYINIYIFLFWQQRKNKREENGEKEAKL